MASITEGIYTHIDRGIIRAGALQSTPTVGFTERDSNKIREFTLTYTYTDKSGQRGGDKKHNLFVGLWEAPSCFIS